MVGGEKERVFEAYANDTRYIGEISSEIPQPRDFDNDKNNDITTTEIFNVQRS